MTGAVNRLLDGLVRPELPLLGLPRSAFQVCGFTGLVACVGVVAGLAYYLGLSVRVVALMSVTGATTFLAVAMAGKWIAGRIQLVFYRQAVAILAAVAGLLVWLDEPLLRYLDLSALGLTTFLVFGRVGCLMVGCCHGKPAGFGVRYRPEHAAQGFSPLLVGVRLFPTQALEAVAALALTTLGVAVVVVGAAPGETLAIVVIGYAVIRFLIELARGDRFRPIVGGFSEAQWISVAAVVGILVLESIAVLPYRRSHVGVAVGLGFVVFFVLAWRYLSHAPRHRLLHPAHIHEIATALDQLAVPHRPGQPIVIATTSLGVQVSITRLASLAGMVEQVSISHRDGPISPENARVVIDLVLMLRGQARRHQIVPSRVGVFHLRLHP